MVITALVALNSVLSGLLILLMKLRDKDRREQLNGIKVSIAALHTRIDEHIQYHLEKQ